MQKPGPERASTPKLALQVLSALFVLSLWPSLRFEPVGLDDQALIQRFSQASLSSIWAFDHFGHLRPVKNLYFWCLAQQPGLLWGLRALNLVAAISCAWLVRSLGLRLGAAPLAAAVAAGLWLFNPTTVTGVAWLAASNYLFALLGALTYALLLDAAMSGKGGRSSWVLAHISLLLAVLSHELAMLTPLWLVYRQRRGPLRSSAKLGAGALVVLALPALLRFFQTAPKLQYRTELPPLQLMASAAYNLEQNLRLWFWPQSSFGVLLSQTSALSPVLCVTSWLSAILCAWLLWRVSRRDRVVAQALAWVMLFLLPLVNLVPIGNTPIAQHYLIIPGVGLSWLSARALVALAPPPLVAAGTTVLLLSWQPAFRQSLHAYESTTSLYETTLRNHPDNLEARVNLIAAYENTGQLTKAHELLDSSLRLAPDHPGLLKNQLSMLIRQQHLPEALAVLDRHAELVRADPELSLRRALVLQQMRRGREAEALFERIWSEPSAPEIHLIAGFQLANIWTQSKRLPEAQKLLRNLHEQFPDNTDISLTLRLIDEALGSVFKRSPTVP